jgi:hypothetical protein
MKPRDILPARGRATSQALMLEVIRPLTATDLIEAASLPAVKLGPPPLKTIRAVHQKAARLVASGRSDLEVSIAVGRGVQRIRDLKVDPSFKELVALYQKELDSTLADEIERGAVAEAEIAELTSEEIIRRLEDDEYIRTLPMSELRQLHQMAADRSIAPPKQAQPPASAPVEITFNIAGRGLRPPAEPKRDVLVIEAAATPDANSDLELDEP